MHICCDSGSHKLCAKYSVAQSQNVDRQGPPGTTQTGVQQTQRAGSKHACCSGSPSSTLLSVDWLACARLDNSI